MKQIIFLKSASAFSGALSVLMELHFFYALCRVIASRVTREVVIVPYKALMLIDISILIVGVLLTLAIDSFLKRGGGEYEPTA